MAAGKKTGGRQKGVPNKLTKQIKEAITTAAEEYGEDGNGKDGMVGYMKRLAGDQPVAFATLLGKVLPMQIEGTGKDGAFKTIHRIELVAPVGHDDASD